MKNLFFILSAIVVASLTYKKPITIDIPSQKWSVINDGVMGGYSNGSSSFIDGSLLFQGKVSFKNNGGFSRVRTPLMDVDLKKSKYVEIEYESDYDFYFTIETEKENSIAIWKSSKIEKGKGMAKIEFDKFHLSRFGQKINKEFSTINYNQFSFV